MASAEGIGLPLNSNMAFLTKRSFFLWTMVGAYPLPDFNAMVMALSPTDELQEDHERL